jgi:hypothetical protein
LIIELAVRRKLGDCLHRPVIVAVIAMRMMEVPIDQIIDMVAVRNLGMTATRPMDMRRIVPGTVMIGRAGIGVRGRDCQHMLFDHRADFMIQVAVVQIIHVALVNNAHMSTMGAVVVAAFFLRRHNDSSVVNG